MKKVVIIEDNLVMQHMLSSWFYDDGFEVISIEDVNDLGYRMDLIKPDLIVTDIMLPDTTATDLIDSFKKVNYPVIVLSSMEEDDLNFFADKIGAVASFRKPVNMNDLFGFINEYFHSITN